MEITIEQARKVLEIVDQGLVKGVGVPAPGQLCVEAAVCLALGESHGDEPSCVANPDRRFKIRLNDCTWSSPQARAAGLRKLSVMQLGTKSLDRTAWIKRLAELTIQRIVPIALRAAILRNPKHAAVLEAAAVSCEKEPTIKNAKAAAAYAAAAAADAADAAAAAATAAADAAEVAAAAADAAAYAADDAAYAAAYAADTAAYAADDAAYAAAYAADDAAYAAYAAAAAADRDRILRMSAECAIQAYRETGAPGVALYDAIMAEAE